MNSPFSERSYDALRVAIRSSLERGVVVAACGDAVARLVDECRSSRCSVALLLQAVELTWYEEELLAGIPERSTGPLLREALHAAETRCLPPVRAAS